jgi:hypothetical protein
VIILGRDEKPQGQRHKKERAGFFQQGGVDMKMEQYIRAIAGSFILISLLLAYFFSPYWLLFTGFVGLNLLQSAFTRWCLMEKFLEKLGVPRSC